MVCTLVKVPVKASCFFGEKVLKYREINKKTNTYVESFFLFKILAHDGGNFCHDGCELFGDGERSWFSFKAWGCFGSSQ